ncbi:MAG: biotin--[acetyl-CoA-carboxylase] ligase [Planctomycetes bacterium]|nr:biotin--[acetyl-CoA-carboxylase] ligase [Planctomycetota bacterium]
MTTPRALPPLDPAAFVGIATERIGRKPFVVASVSSTNDVAFDFLAGGLPEGTTVFAGGQTRGRGRKGRSWHSAPGLGLWFSTILRPTIPRENYSAITAMAAVALRQAIETATGFAPRIAWPNDLVAGPRKLGGILVEARNLDPESPAFVLGVGIDVNQTLADFAPEIRDRATSLAIELGRDVDRAGLALECLECLDVWYSRLLRGDVAHIDEELRAGAALVGQRVALEIGNQIHRGVVRSVSLREGITLLLDSGEERAFPGEQASMRLLPT